MSDNNPNANASTSLINATQPGGDYQAILNVNASPEAVFDAVTTPSAFANWWTAASGGGKAGEELIVHFGDTRLICHVDEAERATRVHWTVLNCEMEHEWDGTTMSFDLQPAANGGARLDFRHQGLTPQLECFEMCQSGWIQALGGLLNYVEKG